MAECFNHGDREAVCRCSICGKALCEECAVKEGNLFCCSLACQEKAAAVAERSDKVVAEKRKTDSANLVRKLIYFFVVILVLAAAYHFMGVRKKAPENVKKPAVKQVQKKSSKAAIPMPK